jgi:hypothetical protein
MTALSQKLVINASQLVHHDYDWTTTMPEFLTLVNGVADHARLMKDYGRLMLALPKM